MTASFTYRACPVGDTVPAAPDDWVPPSLTDVSGVRRAQVAVAQVLPSFRYLGELLQANVLDGRWEDDKGSGGVTIEVPTDDLSIDLLTSDKDIWGSIGLTGRVKVVNRELHVIVDGKVVGCFKPDTVNVAHGTMRLSCVSLPDAYFPGRTLGSVPYDFLQGRGTFPTEDLPHEFTWTGDPGDMQWVAGPRDSIALAIRGDAFDEDNPDRLEIRLGMNLSETTTFNNIVRTAAFMRLPDLDAAQDFDGQLLMTVERYDAGSAGRVWPRPGYEFPDDMIAVVDESRLTGDWDTTPVTAAAVAKRGPYNSIFRTEVYPVSSTTWTYIDEVRIFRRDTLGTGVARDLTDHVLILLRDAQTSKSTWNLPLTRGTDTDTDEVGVWRRDEYQPLTDALAALCDRDDGPAWPWVDYQRRLRCTATRGVDRTETFTIGPDDIIVDDGWSHDPGSQASQVTAQTDYGSDYWRHSSTATDTSRTDGHLIEVTERAPNSMGLRPLDQWTQKELAKRAQPQETRRIWVRPDKGWLLGPCDKFRCVSIDGRTRFDHEVTVVRREFHDQRDLIALDIGVDEAAA